MDKIKLPKRLLIKKIMTKEQIGQKKKTIEDKFKALEAEKQALSNKLNEINSEQLRLQGEFRAIEDLEKEIKEPEVLEAEIVKE